MSRRSNILFAARQVLQANISFYC